jgi:hypothetical protein
MATTEISRSLDTTRSLLRAVVLHCTAWTFSCTQPMEPASVLIRKAA